MLASVVRAVNPLLPSQNFPIRAVPIQPANAQSSSQDLRITIGKRTADPAPPSNYGSSSYVYANGHRFYVVENGDPTKTAVLCMPGALGTAESDFPYQLAGLADQHRVVSFDPRGYGKSRPPIRDWPSDFYPRDARDGLAIMKSLGYSSFNVVGWSDGAIAGVILAATYPDAVLKLVIFGINAWVDENDIAGYEQTRNVELQWSQRMKDVHVPVYGDDLQPMWDGFCEAMIAIFNRGGDVCKEYLRSIKCPCFLLHGAKDPIVGLQHSRWIKENLPHIKQHEFPDGKHTIHLKYPDEFNTLVLCFFAE